MLVCCVYLYMYCVLCVVVLFCDIVCTFYLSLSFIFAFGLWIELICLSVDV